MKKLFLITVLLSFFTQFVNAQNLKQKTIVKKTIQVKSIKTKPAIASNTKKTNSLIVIKQIYKTKTSKAFFVNKNTDTKKVIGKPTKIVPSKIKNKKEDKEKKETVVIKLNKKKFLIEKALANKNTKKGQLLARNIVVAKKKRTAAMVKEKVKVNVAIAKKSNLPITKREIVKKEKELKEIVKNDELIVSNKKVAKSIKVQKIPPPIESPISIYYPFYHTDGSTCISNHFGKIKLNKMDYYNESTTFEMPLETSIICNIDTAIINEVLIDEDSVYTVLLQKNNYLIALHNLKDVQFIKGDTITQNQIIGTIAPNEMNNDKGLLELMLFKNNKLLNPEKYLKQEVAAKDSLALNQFTK